MISIIGAGRVGTALAFLAASMSLDDITIINRTKTKAIGEYYDIVNTIPLRSEITILASDDMSLIKNSDVVIVTVSGGSFKDDRSELLPFNSPIISNISENIAQYASHAKVIVVTNPVDVLVYQIIKKTGLQRNQVIGMGSSLDSSRFRFLMSKEIGVSQNKMEGIVIGEHGPTMIPIYSHVKLDGKNFSFFNQQEEKITHELRNYWKTLMVYKGSSVFGAAKNTFDIIKAIVNNENITIPSSVFLHGEYDQTDIAMGVPVRINKEGATNVIELNLNDHEKKLFDMSATKIRDGINSIPSSCK